MSAIGNVFAHPRLSAFLTGMAAPVLITTICRITGTWGTNWWFLAAALVYTLIGAMIWRGSLKGTVVPLLLAYVAIPFGVVVDATVDWFVWHYDRNLFPFDIVFLFALALFPLGVGVALGKILRSNLPPNTDAQQEPPRAG